MGFLEERAGLAGKVAAIVGGGGGLGRAIANDFADAGVGLALIDRNPEALAETAERARAAGVAVVDAAADARDPEALGAFFERSDAEHGRLDVLVNVVGGTFHQPFADSNPRGWEAIIRANFTTMLHGTHLAIPRMRAGGRGGSIINLTSIEAHRAAPNFAVYAGMKGGVLNFSRTLALELAPDGIRVNCIAPDMVPTEGLGDIASDASPWADTPRGHLGARIAIPMGRAGRYEDVGGCALFLASDLSAYVTGTTLHPDGGAFASAGWFNWPDRGYSNNVPVPLLDVLLADQDK